MPWYASLAIVAIVWTVTWVRSSAIQAFVYSLPIPVTIVMVSTGATVTSDQFFGVVDLLLFFAVVVIAHRLFRRSWLAVLIGVAAYLVVAGAINAAPEIPVPVAAGLVAMIWLAHVIFTAIKGLPNAPQIEQVPRTAGRELGRLGLLVAATALLTFAGGWFGGLSVTFPYAGVLVAFGLGARTHLFARQFALNSIALVAYFVAWWATQSVADVPVRVAAAWAAFLVVSGGVTLLRRWIVRERTDERDEAPERQAFGAR